MKTSNRMLLIFSALGVLIMLALGTWQVQRLQWKNDLIEKRRLALESKPVTLFDIEAGIEHGFDVDWLKTTATGKFRHDLERHVYHLRNGKIGWRVITPFVVPGSLVVMVDRGFVPDDKKDPKTRAENEAPANAEDGSVTITGYARLDGGLAGPFTPANEPDANRWYSIDLIAMAKTMPDNLGFVAPDRYAALVPVFIQLQPDAETKPGELPIVDPVDVKLRNNHLQYAITWYALALVLIVISFLFYRSRNSSKDPAS
ncbi:MAG: SURF1 family protein [Rhizobiales bacterium]|nr:SURF1 family protein [Hyphomicrobiales bacterium]